MRPLGNDQNICSYVNIFINSN